MHDNLQRMRCQPMRRCNLKFLSTEDIPWIQYGMSALTVGTPLDSCCSCRVNEQMRYIGVISVTEPVGWIANIHLSCLYCVFVNRIRIAIGKHKYLVNGRRSKHGLSLSCAGRKSIINDADDSDWNRTDRLEAGSRTNEWNLMKIKVFVQVKIFLYFRINITVSFKNVVFFFTIWEWRCFQYLFYNCKEERKSFYLKKLPL